jgi:predicted RNA-binding Zn ribbon-like protein
MPISANARAGAAVAPGGLDLVQELLNTAPAGAVAPTRDLLGDVASAQDWIAGRAATRHLPAERIGAAGVRRLRALRDDLRAALRARDGRPDGPASVAGSTASVGLALDAEGAVRLAAGPGHEVIAGLVLAEVLLAQERGDWARLKLCALESCSVAFFDRSRNVSGRFHAPRCANHVNLRASRERHRADPA